MGSTWGHAEGFSQGFGHSELCFQTMWSQAAYFKKCVLIQCFMVWGSIHSASYRKLLDDDDVKTINQLFEDSKEDLTNFIDSIFGEECLSDSGCAPLIAFCDRNEGFSGSLGIDGECRPSIWIWIIIISIVIFLIIACMWCIVCGICSSMMNRCRGLQRSRGHPRARSISKREVSLMCDPKSIRYYN